MLHGVKGPLRDCAMHGGNTKVLFLVTQLLEDGPGRVVQGIVRHMDRRSWDVAVGYLYGPADGERVYTDMGIATHCFDLRGLLKGWTDIRGIDRIAAFLRREDVSVLHTHLVRSDIFGRLAGRRARIPVITTIHNMEDHHSGKRLGEVIVRFLDRKTIRISRRIVAVSEAVRRHLHERYAIPLGEITRIHNGIDIPEDTFQLPSKKTLGISEETPVIGTVARLYPQKGIETLIEAVRILAQRGIAVHAVIVGDGPLRETLRRTAGDYGIRDRILFAGFQRNVYPFINCMDVFTLPSRWEGFGLSLIEAMAAGKAVVASRVGGIPEIVEEGRTGFLVRPEDPAGLAEACVILLRNPALRAQCGQAGRARYQQFFTARRMSEAYQDMYRSIILSPGLSGT